MWDTNLQRRVYIAIFGWIAIAHWYTTLRHLSYMISWPSYSVASVNVLMQTMSSETTKCGGSEWQRKNEERKKKKKKRGKLLTQLFTPQTSQSAQGFHLFLSIIDGSSPNTLTQTRSTQPNGNFHCYFRFFPAQF